MSLPVRLLSFSFAVGLASVAGAQIQLTLPAEFDRAWGSGGTSSAMLGQDSSRTQMIYVAPFAPGTVVTEFGVRCAPSTIDRPSFTATIEIRMSSTAAQPGALSATFANNIGNDEVIVLPQQVVTVPAMPANRGTGVFATFPLTTPFVFGTNGNPNICVDFLVHGRSAGASWATDRAFAGTTGAVRDAGIGCGIGTPGSSSTAGVGGTYTDGSTVTFTLTGGPPTSLAFLLPSLDMKEFAPGFPLPLPLSVFGSAANCDLLLNLDFAPMPVITDAAGNASISMLFTGFTSFGFGTQWGYFIPPTAANPFGLEVLRNRYFYVGPRVVVPAAQYVWDLFDVNAATGSATTDSVPIARFTVL
ncbi:MAG: hypothetical protein JNL08_20280 [Planctomycetes bacterium]|nr:hypothetical protein [Planctomycetota bacterium]